MKLFNPDRSTLMEVTSLRRDGSNLVVSGNIMGAMPVTCILTPSEARSALGQLGFKGMLFMITLLFRS